MNGPKAIDWMAVITASGSVAKDWDNLTTVLLIFLRLIPVSSTLICWAKSSKNIN
jgi:hypothetical protein